MDKETYLRFLRALLMNRLPAADAEDIVRFYTEYLEEAGPDKVQEAMTALGSPEELTAKIMEQRAKEEAEGLREPAAPEPRAYTIPVENSASRWLGIALVILAGICIVPPLGGLFIGFAVGGIALIVCGALMFALLGVLGGVIGSMLLGIGSGLVMISSGSLLIQAAKGMLYLMKKAMKGLWNALVEREVEFHYSVN